MKTMHAKAFPRLAALALAIVLCGFALFEFSSRALATERQAIPAVAESKTDLKPAAPGAFSKEVYARAGFSAEQSAQLAARQDEDADLTTFCTLLWLADCDEREMTAAESNIRSAQAQEYIAQARKLYGDKSELEPAKLNELNKRVEVYITCMDMTPEEKADYMYELLWRSNGFESAEAYEAYLESQKPTPEQLAAWAAEDAALNEAKKAANGGYMGCVGGMP